MYGEPYNSILRLAVHLSRIILKCLKIRVKARLSGIYFLSREEPRKKGLKMKTFGEIFGERCINIRAFARQNDLKPTTLYTITSGETDPHKIGIDTWLKIAHGLGMTADELVTVVFGDTDA